MAFKMVCPHCKKILNVTEKAFGRTVPCPGCNQPLAIPQDPESLPPLRPVKTSSSQQEDIKATFRGSGTTGDRRKKMLNQGIYVVKKKPWILAPVGGGILLALLLATWLIVDGSSGPAKPKQWQTVEFDPFHQPTSPSHRPSPHQPSDAEGLAACSGCAGCAVLVPVVIIAIIVLHIALLVWVARDAKARGMDSAALWMILVMATGLLGLIIFIFSRPQGNLLKCASCGNKRLQVSAQCPHCGNA